MVQSTIETKWELIKAAFRAPEPVTGAPMPPPVKPKRVLLTQGPLTRLQESELMRSVHHYNLHEDSWLPHVRKLTSITAQHYSPDSNKMFYKVWTEFELDDKYYRMQIFIKRYQPDIRTVEEISKKEFQKVKTIVFNKALIAGAK